MLVAAAAFFAGVQAASSQQPAAHDASTDQSSFQSVCNDERSNEPTRAVLRLVCQQRQFIPGQSSPADTIVIGFVGGFTKADDAKRPEVLFAAYLREHYTNSIHARVFGNHEDKKALSYITQLLDTNHDGMISMSELTAYMDTHLTELTDGDQKLGLDQRFQGDIFVDHL